MYVEVIASQSSGVVLGHSVHRKVVSFSCAYTKVKFKVLPHMRFLFSSTSPKAFLLWINHRGK